MGAMSMKPTPPPPCCSTSQPDVVPLKETARGVSKLAGDFGGGWTRVGLRKWSEASDRDVSHSQGLVFSRNIGEHGIEQEDGETQ